MALNIDVNYLLLLLTDTIDIEQAAEQYFSEDRKKFGFTSKFAALASENLYIPAKRICRSRPKIVLFDDTFISSSYICLLGIYFRSVDS
jgi:hypothetical protein